jgi:hypothetical protein
MHVVCCKERKSMYLCQNSCSSSFVDVVLLLLQQNKQKLSRGEEHDTVWFQRLAMWSSEKDRRALSLVLVLVNVYLKLDSVLEASCTIVKCKNENEIKS